jgi:DNA-binding transcriptional ArsR family regulator
MNAFDVLGDPVRRRILELLSDGELTAGAVSATIQAEFGITQPAVSAQLRILREAGFATVRPDGARRLYAVNGDPLRHADAWLGRFRRFWAPHLDALETEIARGKRTRRRETAAAQNATSARPRTDAAESRDAPRANTAAANSPDVRRRSRGSGKESR